MLFEGTPPLCAVSCKAFPVNINEYVIYDQPTVCLSLVCYVQVKLRDSETRTAVNEAEMKNMELHVQNRMFEQVNRASKPD